MEEEERIEQRAEGGKDRTAGRGRKILGYNSGQREERIKDRTAGRGRKS